MREKKFRYRVKERKTGEVTTFICSIQDVEIRPYHPNPFGSLDWEILSRDDYTGLLDKHGKEIYEGDRVSFWFEELIFKDTVSGEIEWCNDFAQFMILLPEHGVSIPIAELDLSFAELEVIGNIYEGFPE